MVLTTNHLNMKKINTISVIVLLSLLVVNCKSEKKEQNFKAITDAYFEAQNDLNPLDATQNGQNEYNDKLVFEMTDSYRKKQAAFYDKFENELKTIDTTALSAEEKIATTSSNGKLLWGKIY